MSDVDLVALAWHPSRMKTNVGRTALAVVVVVLTTVVYFDREVVAEAAPSPKIQAAQQAFKLYEASYRAGTGSIESVYIWSRRWLDAERVPHRNAAKSHLVRMQALEAEAKKRVAAGTGNQAEAAAAAFYLAEASELSASP